MPEALTIVLGASRQGLRIPSAQQLHGAVANLVREADESHQAGEKPWALHPALKQDKELLLTINWLDDRQPPEVFTEGLPTEIRLGPAFHPVLRARSDHASWAELARETSTAVTMEFVSPMWFSRNGRTYPLPDPLLIYRRLLQRWETYSDTPIPAEVSEQLLGSVYVDDLEGETVTYDLGKGRRLGFLGQVRFAIERDQTVGHAFAALSKFAEYCGVGAQTTYGAGMVRIVAD